MTRLLAMTCAALSLFGTAPLVLGQAAPPAGEIKGSGIAHTPESVRAAIDNASVALPARIAGGKIYAGPMRQAPAVTGKAPAVLFLHGSSGLGLKAIGEWQQWLAEIGIASFAPDSFSVPDRMTYKSPVEKQHYEKIHALRASEIAFSLTALKSAPWADASRLMLAGSSEGAVAVARNSDTDFIARMIFAWSCETNYFVSEHGTKSLPEQPVLNVISAADPFFSQRNGWLGNPGARGHCAEAFAGAKYAEIVLIPEAPHTLLNLPQARAAARAFFDDVLKLETSR